jgi:hypothetical protein
MRDEQLKAIGRVVVNFSGLEFFYEVLAWSLASMSQDVGLIVTSELSFQQKRNLVCALTRESLKLHPAAALEIDELAKESRKIEEERNRIMHSLWGPLTTDPEGPLARVKFTAKGQLRKQGEAAVDPTQLISLADQISQLTGKLMEFFRRYASAIPYRVPQVSEEEGKV